MTPIVECRNLTKIYGGQRVALNNLNLSLGRGRIIGILGPNGSGKTTFLKMLAGLLTPTEGTLLIDGKNIGVETKKIVSYLPDTTYLSQGMKVEHILKLFGEFYEDFQMDRAKEMILRLGIRLEDPLKTLSKGTKEKVQLILVMSRNADLYVLDEPMGGIDPAARDYILSTILSNYKENGTILISTHLITDVEQILDEVVMIREGNLMLHSSVDEIRNKMGKSIDSLFREVFRC